MENLREEESKTISKGQMFVQILEILTQQGLIREDEKNRMKVMLTQMPELK